MSLPGDEVTGLMDAHIDESRVRADNFEDVRDRNQGRRQKERSHRPRPEPTVNSVSVFQQLTINENFSKSDL